MAYVVRSPGSNLSEVQIMDFVAKQVQMLKISRHSLFRYNILLKEGFFRFHNVADHIEHQMSLCLHAAQP